jgi:MinD-like ATPase involved in chromosome partitioning or flagellar assembly
MGSIITFYSYKGGVGRTMALANVAVLLARRGLRVMMVDWDLEAPGLHQFFPLTKRNERGLLEFLDDASQMQEGLPKLENYTSSVAEGGNTLTLLAAGRFDQDYERRVLQFDWPKFFEKQRGGSILETLRDQWRDAFDVTLIDSRTGITDAGGVCTIQMPDILVPVVVANRQSIEGTKKIVQRAQQARQALAYDRTGLLVFPLLSRFDSRTEYQESQKWLRMFADDLNEFYSDWLPKEVTAVQVAERTKLPYVADFSFGEKLPVITESTTDPESLGFAYETAATLIADDFKDAQRLLLSRVRSPRTEKMEELPKIPATNLRGNISLPSDFFFREVIPDHRAAHPPPPPAPLGPLAAFVGDWVGNGFNTIFRPDNAVTPTPLPNPGPSPPPPHHNILELNLTSEELSFSKNLGAVPNRGTNPQGDIFLNGVPYLQTINDVTIHGEKIGIHFEPGIWIHVPATTVPPIAQETIARLASIPHGTTIEAQGIIATVAGPPKIDPVDITPFVTGNPAKKIKFPSQIASDPNTRRIPQDLSSFRAAVTITQALLDDPNRLLRSHISKQKIINTIALIISTAPPPPPALFGGGIGNIAFLLGHAAAYQPNAQAARMTAIFWIETVEEVILVPPLHAGQPFTVRSKPSVPGQHVPKFSGIAPFAVDRPRELTVHFTQIQYTQTVLLNFAGLTWPHVSVNTLVPADNMVVPASAWT